MAGADVQDIIDRILASERMGASSHFSNRVYGDEPILTTGSRMASYLPDRYRDMRAISRWREDAQGRGRWLTEAELFWRQATFMADWEDDRPYRGEFKNPHPTYNAMSDRQLRGYFTWRARVRAGEGPEAPAGFAYTLLYELVCGIGEEDPHRALELMERLAATYGAAYPALARDARSWAVDLAAYRGLGPEALGGAPGLARERRLLALASALEDARRALPGWRPRALVPWPVAGAEPLEAGARRRSLKAGVPDLGDELEWRLFDALDALSTYRPSLSPLHKAAPRDLRHLVVATVLRLADRYDGQRKLGLLEGFFGSYMELPYTMFGSAVFWQPAPHADADAPVHPLRRYRCRAGAWTCARVHGIEGPSAKLGQVLDAVDAAARRAFGDADASEAVAHPPLTAPGPIPRYLAIIIDEEVAARRAWNEAHRPISIDLSRLGSIRDAAAWAREALLVDEEREGGAAVASVSGRGPILDGAGAHGGSAMTTGRGDAAALDPEAESETWAVPPIETAAAPAPPRPARPPRAEAEPPETPPSGLGGPAVAVETPTGPLSPVQAAYLAALLAGDAEAARAAIERGGTTEDLLVDAVNEALFDLLGDTALEYVDGAPRAIEDYREDLEEILAHAS